MEESAVHSSVENSCNLVGVYGAVREQGCQERVLAPHEERNGKVNVRKRKGQRSTHEGCWRLMPSTKQIHTKLQPILSKKTKPYALYSDPMPHSVIPCPGKSHRLFFSSRRFCAVESCIVFCCGWDRPDGKQQLSTHQSCAFLNS